MDGLIMPTDTLLWITVALVIGLTVNVLTLLREVRQMRIELNNARDRIIDIWSKTGCEL
jgi:hypothetical protein